MTGGREPRTIGAVLRRCWRVRYAVAVGTEEDSAGVWRSLTVQDVARVIAQVKGQHPLPSSALETIATAVSVRRDLPVHFTAQRRQIGDVGVALMSMSGIRVAGLAAQRSNTVHLAFLLDGQVQMTPRESASIVLEPGACFMITNWSSFDVEAREGIRALHLLIPEAVLRARGVRVKSTRFRLEGSTTLKGPLLALALSTVDPEWAPSTSAQRATAKALEDLAIAYLAESDDHELDRADLRAQLRRRSVEEISLRHRDAALNPAALARHLGVSLRHLQRAYEGSGTTISDQILHHRTESAVTLLSSPAGRSLTVAEQARIAGFSSAYELRSAVRSKLGMLPTELRAASQDAISVPESAE